MIKYFILIAVFAATLPFWLPTSLGGDTSYHFVLTDSMKGTYDPGSFVILRRSDSYAIGDLRLGLISNEGGWQVDLFVYNITDERAQIFINEGDKEWVWGRTGEYEHVQDVFTNRPREYGLRFSKKWGD